MQTVRTTCLRFERRVEDLEADTSLKLVSGFDHRTEDRAFTLDGGIEAGTVAGKNEAKIGVGAEVLGEQGNGGDLPRVANLLCLGVGQASITLQHVESEKLEAIQLVTVATDARPDKLTLEQKAVWQFTNREGAKELRENRILIQRDHPVPGRSDKLAIEPAEAEGKAVQLFRGIKRAVRVTLKEITHLVQLSLARARDAGVACNHGLSIGNFWPEVDSKTGRVF